ncbi:hypothetical protein HPB49_001156 [Dermacentor silvarum]|uniref:Uncharacterized protein n=1 Tax=Dermacentor silvarum TaxID=543639 RepID=A0ACB8DSS9_DERSI|nr:hypothetical protein HPB49_001156 [Dermacentor silvarum]
MAGTDIRRDRKTPKLPPVKGVDPAKSPRLSMVVMQPRYFYCVLYPWSRVINPVYCMRQYKRYEEYVRLRSSSTAAPDQLGLYRERHGKGELSAAPLLGRCQATTTTGRAPMLPRQARPRATGVCSGKEHHKDQASLSAIDESCTTWLDGNTKPFDPPESENFQAGSLAAANGKAAVKPVAVKGVHPVAKPAAARPTVVVVKRQPGAYVQPQYDYWRPWYTYDTPNHHHGRKDSYRPVPHKQPQPHKHTEWGRGDDKAKGGYVKEAKPIAYDTIIHEEKKVKIDLVSCIISMNAETRRGVLLERRIVRKGGALPWLLEGNHRGQTLKVVERRWGVAQGGRKRFVPPGRLPPRQQQEYEQDGSKGRGKREGVLHGEEGERPESVQMQLVPRVHFIGSGSGGDTPRFSAVPGSLRRN